MGKNSEKIVSQCRKKLKGDLLVLPFGMVCYAEKQGKPFWSSSLGQMEFDTIIFGRALKNYFGQFVWIKKVTIIVAFHCMKRRLKTFGNQLNQYLNRSYLSTAEYSKIMINNESQQISS